MNYSIRKSLTSFYMSLFIILIACIRRTRKEHSNSKHDNSFFINQLYWTLTKSPSYVTSSIWWCIVYISLDAIFLSPFVQNLVIKVGAQPQMCQMIYRQCIQKEGFSPRKASVLFSILVKIDRLVEAPRYQFCFTLANKENSTVLHQKENTLATTPFHMLPTKNVNRISGNNAQSCCAMSDKWRTLAHSPTPSASLQHGALTHSNDPQSKQIAGDLGAVPHERQIISLYRASKSWKSWSNCTSVNGEGGASKMCPLTPLEEEEEAVWLLYAETQQCMSSCKDDDINTINNTHTHIHDAYIHRC